jgi:S1-C subfamily serine protease
VNGSPRRLLPLAALVGAGVLGAALALAGAAALGDLGTTKTIRELDAKPAGAAPAAFERPGRPLSVNQIFRRTSPGVVQVTSTSVVNQPDPFGFGFDTQQTQQALGSGFVIDTAGHIVTNYHVVQNARAVQVSFSNHDSMKARIVGSDPSTDIAVLQVDAHSRALTPLPLGNSDRISVGDSVVAIGNPFGLDRTVTAGIVSALQRAITAPNQYTIGHVIQTDAPINHGNSGGPLIDARGDVIGVTSQIETGGTGDGNVGIGFAIPINTVRSVVAQLIKNGKVEHAYLGVKVQPIEPSIARLFKLPSQHGLLVATVESGSGAAAAGLRPGTNQVVVSGETYSLGGDLIVAADGRPVSTGDDLRDAIASKRPGQRVSLTIYRGTKKMTVDVKLGRQPSSPLG